MVSLCRGWPGTRYVGQAGLKLIAISLSAESTAENHHVLREKSNVIQSVGGENDKLENINVKTFAPKMSLVE